ncbi:unnamed protein product [Dibothriocephalus latus]|uniref:Meiosis-specific nuclear structural protein 1 n=1 Tax=Dibothriocephalus latus TaxID=60516 RepID=A0A3P6UD06_DIBLA|nr:unnamed protein product [Dibothriocephalus latus]
MKVEVHMIVIGSVNLELFLAVTNFSNILTTFSLVKSLFLHFLKPQVERNRMLNAKSANVDMRLASTLRNREEDDARDLALRKMANDVRYGCYLNQIAQEEVAADQMRAQEAQKRREEFKADMQQQAETREQRRLEAYKEFLRDKMLIDEVVRKIHEEDQREAERKLVLKRENKALIEEFKVCQENWKKAEAKRIQAENERVARYLAEQETRVKESDAGKAERQQRLEEVQANLAKIIQQKEQERTEMENLSQLLAQEKENARAAQHEAAELEEKLRRRLILHKEHELYMARRAKECERLVEEKRNRLEEQKKQEQAEALAQCEREDYRRKIIEEERIRLLQEHAGSLLDEKEFAALDDKVKSALRAAPGPAAYGSDAESTSYDSSAQPTCNHTFDYTDLRSSPNTPALRRPF